MRTQPLLIDESRTSLIHRLREARAKRVARGRGEALERFRREREAQKRRAAIARCAIVGAVIGLASFVLLHAGGAR